MTGYSTKITLFDYHNDKPDEGFDKCSIVSCGGFSLKVMTKGEVPGSVYVKAVQEAEKYFRHKIDVAKKVPAVSSGAVPRVG